MGEYQNTQLSHALQTIISLKQINKGILSLNNTDKNSFTFVMQKLLKEANKNSNKFDFIKFSNENNDFLKQYVYFDNFYFILESISEHLISETLYRYQKEKSQDTDTTYNDTQLDKNKYINIITDDKSTIQSFLLKLLSLDSLQDIKKILSNVEFNNHIKNLCKFIYYGDNDFYNYEMSIEYFTKNLKDLLNNLQKKFSEKIKDNLNKNFDFLNFDNVKTIVIVTTDQTIQTKFNLCSQEYLLKIAVLSNSDSKNNVFYGFSNEKFSYIENSKVLNVEDDINKRIDPKSQRTYIYVQK